MNKKLLLALLVILIIIILAAAASNSHKKETGPIKIGVSTLLTGDFAVLGENIVNATRLAAKEINDAGGIEGRQVELVIEDAGYTSKDGLNSMQKLINIDKVRYVVAGMSSNGTLAAASLIDQNKVVAMTPVTGGKNIDEAGEYIFRNANSDILAGRDLANAMIKLGYKNVAVVSEVTEYTLDIKKVFEDTIKSQGGAIVASEEFQPDTKDYRSMIAKVRGLKPQALLVLSQLGTNAAQFIKQSRELGFNPPLFTDFTFATNEAAKKIVGSFEGIYFADPAYDITSPQSQAFFTLYQKTYGTPSAIPFHAAASYDAMMMYRDAIKAVGDDPEKVKNWLLANIKNRKGLMGTFSFDEKGNSDLGFIVKVIKNGKPVAI